MRNRFFTLLILIIPCFLKAQEISIEPKLLISDLYYISKQDNGNLNFWEPDYKSKLSFGAAVNVSKISKKIPLEIGVQYLRLRTKHNLVDDGIANLTGAEDVLLPWAIDDLIVSLDYFFFNVSYGFQLSNKFHLDVGPQIGYLIEWSKTGSPGSEAYASIFKPANEFDYGINFGISYSLSPKTLITTEFYNGFNSTEEAPIPDPSGAKNRYFALGLSYLVFKFKDH